MGAMSPTSIHKHLHARANEHAPTHVKARSGTNKNPTDSSKPSETACFNTFPYVRNLICDDRKNSCVRTSHEMYPDQAMIINGEPTTPGEI